MESENTIKKEQSKYEECIEEFENYAKNGLLLKESKQIIGLEEGQSPRMGSTLKQVNRKQHEKQDFYGIKYNILYNLAKKIVNKEMTLEKGANALKMHTSIFVLELLKITDRELQEKIQEILMEKGLIKEKNPTKSLFSYPYKVVEELILVALTYRTSEEDIARIIGRTPLEVHEVFFSLKFSHYGEALSELYLELLTEEEEVKKYSYKRALSYYEERNRLYKFLNVAKKENNVALVERLQNEIKKHLKLVDDTSIIQNIKKKTFKELSEEEKDAVGYYLLRYYPTKTKATQELRLNYAAIDKCKNQLAAKDDFYALKIQRYDRKVAIRNPFQTNYEEEQKRR